MLESRPFTVVLSCLCLLFSGVLVFELGMYISNTKYLEQIAALEASHDEKLGEIGQTMAELDLLIDNKDDQIQDLIGNKEELAGKITELNEQIAGLDLEESPYPFTIPSTGTIGSYVSTFHSNYKGSLHYGVDLWTTTENGGAISTHRGNPVFAACSGVVVTFQPENGGVTISCDTIPSSFNISPRKVYTYYGHMANAVTNEKFIYVQIGQRVRKGEFIGYQGDLSMYTPGMRNVHLHFSVFTGPRERDGSQDPCKYIGGSCTEVGRFLVNDVK